MIAPCPCPDPVPVVIHDLGDTALSVDFGNRIDPSLTRRVLALDALLARLAPAGIVETVPSYRALLVVVDPLVADITGLRKLLAELATTALPDPGAVRLWELPVVYGGAHGPDLDEVAARCAMSARAVVAAHSRREYTVAMIGFLPGFCYLSGLDPRLTVPRRATPRPRIPPSSIAIGGAQSSIGSVAGPSGWHLIGRTPVQPFQPGRTPEFLFAPGDRIRLVPVPAAAWSGLDAEAQAGAPVARLVVR